MDVLALSAVESLVGLLQLLLVLGLELVVVAIVGKLFGYEGFREDKVLASVNETFQDLRQVSHLHKHIFELFGFESPAHSQYLTFLLIG